MTTVRLLVIRWFVVVNTGLKRYFLFVRCNIQFEALFKSLYNRRWKVKEKVCEPVGCVALWLLSFVWNGLQRPNRVVPSVSQFVVYIRIVQLRCKSSSNRCSTV